MSPKFRTWSEGGSPGLTLFSDSLQRTTGLGVNWMIGYYDPTQASAATPTIATLSTGLELGNTSGGGSSSSVLIQPVVLGAIIGLSQFAQVTLVSNGGAGNFPSAGPAVATQGDPLSATSNGYFANIQPTNNFLQIRVANVGQRLVQNNIGSTVANGVTVRISVIFQPTQNVITISINGIVQGTFTDSNAARPITGLPGIFYKGAGNTGTEVLSNFSGGLGA
jgi:hypothetical protein